MTLFAFVRSVKGTTRHTTGTVRLPSPDIAIIEQRQDGVFLLRFTCEGAFGGDTWHSSFDDAKTQAEYEYVLDAPWRHFQSQNNGQSLAIELCSSVR
jgi:hypothetical protein